MRNPDFLTAYGHAFVAIEAAREAVGSSPEALRPHLNVMLESVKADICDDMTRTINRAATEARRIAMAARASARGAEGENADA